MRGLFGPGTIVLGGVAMVLTGLLALGFFLPREWSASAEAVLAVDAVALTPWVDSPDGWRRWTAWPDSGLLRSGPERGPGSSLSWSDRELGSGSFTLTENLVGGGVRYSVEVEGAGNSVLVTSGLITFEPVPGGTRVHWAESGDLGGNPLMGYWALAMGRLQGAEMAKGLDRLGALVVTGSGGDLGTDEGGTVPSVGPTNGSAPADSGSTGA